MPSVAAFRWFHDQAESKWRAEKKRARPQFGLATAMAVMTLCAVYALLTRLVGFIPVIAAVYGITLGVLVGVSLDCHPGALFEIGYRRSVGRPSCCFVYSRMVALRDSKNIPALEMTLPLWIPVIVLLDVHVIFYGTAIVLLGVVPIAAIAAVHDRSEGQTVVRVHPDVRAGHHRWRPDVL